MHHTGIHRHPDDFSSLPILKFLFSVPAVESAVLQLNKISRLQMGEYLCVASNGVMPSASKKFRVSVQCKPPPVTTARMIDFKLFIFKFIYFLGFSRVIKVTSKYLLTEISIFS